MSPLDKNYDEIIDKIATSKARLILLETLKEEGEPDRVIKACHKALETFPDDISVRRLLAETYFEQGAIELAEIELDKITKYINELSLIFKLKYDILRKGNRIEEAINSLKLYLAHHGDDKDAAQVLSELGEPQRKKPAAIPTATLAEIYYKQGELEEAIRTYEQVVEASPEDEKAKLRLSELKEMKETDKMGEVKEDLLKQKKIKLLELLERWLANIEQIGVINPS